MNKSQVLIGYKVIFPLLVLAAIMTQLQQVIAKPNGSIVNFFSFFTIQSNLLGAVVLIVSAYRLFKKCMSSAAFDMLRGAAALYMVITGIIYSLLLAGADVQTPIPWINIVLHYVFPIVMLLDWLVDRPGREISVNRSLIWLSYPFAYLVYTLIRAPLINDWYPYPFLNVAQHGYAQVALSSASIAIAASLLAVLVSRLPHIISNQKH